MRALLKISAFYEAFQAFAGSGALRRLVVSELIRPKSGMKILDIGCGTADILSYLPADCQYTGYDVNERYIASARAKFGSRGSFINSAVEDIQSLEKGFDLVFCVGVLHHLNDDAFSQFVKLAASSLVKDGRFFAVEPIRRDGRSILEATLMSLDRGRYIRRADEYLKIIGERLKNPSFQYLPRLYRIPWTLGVCSAHNI